MEKYTSIAINGIGTKEVSEAVMAALVNSGWVISDSAGAEDRDLYGGRIYCVRTEISDEEWDALYASIPWTKCIVVYIGV